MDFWTALALAMGFAGAAGLLWVLALGLVTVAQRLRRRRIYRRRDWRRFGTYRQALRHHVDQTTASHWRHRWVEPDPRNMWR